MRRFHTCICSIAHLPVAERRFIENLIADSRAGRSIVARTDLSIVPHHDGYMIHVGVLEDHADRPISIPPVLWQLLGIACEEGATWLSFDREEAPRPDLPVYPDDPPSAATARSIAIQCEQCGSADVMRDAWARWDPATQAWTLGTVFDAAFCNACEADATLVKAPLAPLSMETAA